MPKKKIPGYLRHKSGQARVVLGGITHYLGIYNSPESRKKYDQLIAVYLTNGVAPLPIRDDEKYSIEEAALIFMKFAEQHYKKHGRPTQTHERYRLVLELVVKYYGKRAVSAFGPLALKFIREQMIESGTLCRNTINDRIDCIRAFFRWLVSEEICSFEIYEALKSVKNLEKGRSEAPESEPVEPVSIKIIEKTLPFLPPIVADMVRVQLFLGCRPGEVCSLRSCDINYWSSPWIYNPAEFKTEHLGGYRYIPVGPKCQAILIKYIIQKNDYPQAYLFSPRDSVRIQKNEKREKRKTKVQPSQIDRSKEDPKRQAGEKYTTASYRRAIHRACEKAGVEQWSPNQLRHKAGTDIRDIYGIESAQAILGHTNLKTTELYAKTQLEKAKEIASKIG